MIVRTRLWFAKACLRWKISRFVLLLVWVCCVAGGVHGDTPFSFEISVDRVIVSCREKQIAEYRFADQQVSHPYWSRLDSLSSKQLTRNHPPIEGVDATDHIGMHTGVWLSFGDVNGNDYWRLKAAVQQSKLEILSQEERESAAFRVENIWYSQGERKKVLEDETLFRFHLVDDGYLLEWDTKLRADERDVVFGEQEEMGLGLRMATSIAVDKNMGGRMLDSEGRLNGKEIWGEKAEWCDYAGPMEKMWCGITVLVDAQGGRSCRCHARDYGFLAMNPFSTQVFKQGKATPYTLAKGKEVRLRFGLYVHENSQQSEFSVVQAQRVFNATEP